MKSGNQDYQKAKCASRQCCKEEQHYHKRSGRKYHQRSCCSMHEYEHDCERDYKCGHKSRRHCYKQNKCCITHTHLHRKRRKVHFGKF